MFRFVTLFSFFVLSTAFSPFARAKSAIVNVNGEVTGLKMVGAVISRMFIIIIYHLDNYLGGRIGTLTI